MNLQMVDVVGQYRKIKGEVDAAVLRVMESGQFIMGKEVAGLEQEVGRYLGVKHAIGCASGTDALQLSMMALGIGRGDEVVTTPFTFVATTETIALLGARPVYVDIDPATFNINVGNIERALTAKTKAIIPVHLYGQSADMGPLMDLSRQKGIPVIEDLCQAIGSDHRGTKVGGIGMFGAISFFPSKNLGAFGDGGMVVTNDDVLADRVRMVAAHGSRVRYKHEILGVNSRLDAIQAAILRVKLRYLEDWIAARRTAAKVYDRLFQKSPVTIPVEASWGRHVYHQYTVRISRRDAVAAHLTRQNVPHAVYYPIPLYRQDAFADFRQPAGKFPESEKAALEVLSLPMHTELTEEQQVYIAGKVVEALA